MTEYSNVVDIVVPDRYESLVRRAGSNLNIIVEEIEEASRVIDRTVRRMKTAGRGALLVLRGDSGSGKSTFLHTLHLFKNNIRTKSVPPSVSIREFLESQPLQPDFMVYVLEEREAAVSFTDEEIETWLHEINGFLRSDKGERALVVWPCNTDALRDRIAPLAKQIGGRALIGPGDGWVSFTGPSKERFSAIAEKTLNITNQSASLADLGLTKQQIEISAQRNELIGDFFSDIHNVIENLQGEVAALVDKERCRLWVVVIAGNDPGPDVQGLTRG